MSGSEIFSHTRASSNNSAVAEGAADVVDMIDRLAAAVSTLRRMSSHGIRPAAMRAAWPNVVQSFFDAYGSDPGPLRPPLPSPAEISDADAVILLLHRLDGDQRLLVWMRASGFKWRRLEHHFGLGQRMLQYRYRTALLLLVEFAGDGV